MKLVKLSKVHSPHRQLVCGNNEDYLYRIFKTSFSSGQSRYNFRNLQNKPIIATSRLTRSEIIDRSLYKNMASTAMPGGAPSRK